MSADNLAWDVVDFSSLLKNKSGLERESLRVCSGFQVTKTPHPEALGHKLTHPSITVDFSEGLLELVTPAYESRGQMLSELQRLHSFVAKNLGPGEQLWPLSMPPSASEEQIQIADFGPSLSGRMKEVYRQGLANRYGKVMQIIAGIHYNFSFAQSFIDYMHGLYGEGLSEMACRNRLYFRLIRGFDRQAWILPYLFGASPVAAASSVGPGEHGLIGLEPDYVYGEYATSLRMSDIGYKSPAQKNLHISHSNVQDYVRDLVNATRTPWADFEKISAQSAEAWPQLNSAILQIENEYYSAIRPKQITERGERPACALHNRGVQYIEIRMLDVDPFEPLGISRSTAHFLECFMLSCLAVDGKADSPEAAHNQDQVIRLGRKPGLTLKKDGQDIALTAWAEDVLACCEGIAARLDEVHGGQQYRDAVKAQQEKLAKPDLLPSQRVLSAASAGYKNWAQQLSRDYSQQLMGAELSASDERAFEQLASESFAAAATVQAEQCCSFEEYVASYYASLCGDSLAA